MSMVGKLIKVSVIIPVYNVEEYIHQCLDSIVNQTLKELEIILIDDRSPDKSKLVYEKFAAKDSRIIVIHNEKNIGQGFSRNKGIDIAKGEYIAFIDPDDWVDLDFFEKLYDAAIQNNANIAKTERKKVHPNGRITKESTLNKYIKKQTKKNVPLFLLFGYEHTTAIYKRDIIVKNNVKYAEINNAQDNVFLLEAAYFAKSIALVSGTFYYYRQHSLSSSAIRNQDYFDCMLKYMEIHINFINKHEMDKAHYDLSFLKAFNATNRRFKLLKKNPELNDYKRQYVTKIYNTLTLYKYDMAYLVDIIAYGFKYQRYSMFLRDLKKKPIATLLKLFIRPKQRSPQQS